MAEPQELRQLQAKIPVSELSVCSTDLIHFKLQASNERTVNIVLHLLTGYPVERPHVAVKCEAMSRQTLSKITETIQKVANKPVAAEDDTSLFYIYTAAKSLVQDNLLLFARDEVLQIKDLLTGQDSMSINESKGKIKLDVRGGESHRVVFSVAVPPKYPYDPVALTCISSTFHANLTEIIFGQATEISRRCAQGIPPDVPLHKLDGEEPGEKKREPEPVSFNSKNIHSMKHDVHFLHELSSLKDAVAETNDKRTRKFKKFVEKKELEHDRQM
eukprot:Selendium_serpulae@DN6221_c0_g1_i12.p1